MSYMTRFYEKVNALLGRNDPRIAIEEWERKRKRENIADFEKAREAIKVLVEFSNRCGNSEILRLALVDELLHTHLHIQGKTLQQILLALGDLGIMMREHPAGVSDGRNEFEMKILDKMQNALSKDLYWKDSNG